MPDLGSPQALAAVARTLAAIEEDCSQAWPRCPRSEVSLICDCRLRAVRAINALKMLPE